MKKFVKIQLGSFINLITDYHANGSYKVLKSNIQIKYKPDYAIMIRTLNFEQNDFTNDLIYIDEHAYNFLSKSIVMPNDILINKIANPGNIYLMPDINKKVSCGMNLFLIRFDNKVNQIYMYYNLKSNEKKLKKLAHGTTTKTITKDDIRDFEIIMHHDVSTQNIIAYLLYYIDKSIELKYKINSELEQMAKILYNYWFIQFDFPDENGRPYKSSGGKMVWNEELKKEIPEGWEVKYINDIAKTTAKNIIPINNVLYKYYSLPSVSKNKSYIEEYGNNILSSKYIINHNCILVNKLNPLDSRVIFIPNEDNQICSTEFIVLQQENNFLRSYIYSTLCSEHFKIYCKQRISGAIHKRVAPQLVYNYKISYNENIVNKYGNIIYNILFKINNAIQENRELTSLRDFLLPLLMNGQALI